jgi:hypothetical protein
MQTSRIKPALACYMIVMAVMNVCVVWQLRSPVLRGYGDFAAFYTAGKLVQEGRSAELYNPQSQWQVQQQFAPAVNIRHGPLPYVRPPFQALLYLPFAYLNYHSAFLVWTSIKLVLLFASTWLLTGPGSKLFAPALSATLLLGFFPVAIDFLQGQDAILLLFVLVLFYRLLMGQRMFAAGCVLALGLFKFHLVLPLALLFLLRRQFRFLYGFALVAFAEAAISIASSGWTVVWIYPRYVLALAHNPGTGFVNSYDMPNVRALLAVLSGPEPPQWFLLLIAAAAIALVAWIWQNHRAGDNATALSISLAVVVTLLTSQYAYSHDLVLLAIPLVLLQNSIVGEAEISGQPRVLFLLAMGVLAFTPLYWFVLLRTSYFYLASTLPLGLAAIALTWAIRREPQFPVQA